MRTHSPRSPSRHPATHGLVATLGRKVSTLLGSHREILKECPGILTELHECHEAVQSAKGGLRPQ